LGTDMFGQTSVMLGCKGGVLAKLQETSPNIIGWHCVNHQLELSVYDVVKCMTDINHFSPSRTNCILCTVTPRRLGTNWKSVQQSWAPVYTKLVEVWKFAGPLPAIALSKQFRSIT